MKLFATTAAFIGFAVAATVTDTTVRDNNGIQSIAFTIDGVRCSASKEQLAARQVVCPGSPFSYHIDGSEPNYTLTLFKGITNAPSAHGELPISCRAGGAGPDDKVCQQYEDLTIDI